MTDKTSVDDRPIPDRLATEIQRAFGLAEPPATLGEWTDTTAQLLGDAEFDFGVDAMCTGDDTRHVAWIDGDPQGFHCVLDTLLLPFAADDQSQFDVRSESPVSDATIGFTVRPDGVQGAPSEAVMSFGVEQDVSVPTDEELDPAVAYARFCPYVNAFPGEAEYQAWERETPGAVTMVVSLDAGFELARLLAQSPPFTTQ